MEKIKSFRNWETDKQVQKFLESNGIAIDEEGESEFAEQIRHLLVGTKARIKVEDKDFDNQLFDKLLTIEIPLGDFE